MNETQKFLEDTGETTVDIMDMPLDGSDAGTSTTTTEDDGTEDGGTTTSAEDPENQPDGVKNRRHRRLEARLQAERESNIALNARLAAIAEARREAGSAEDDFLKGIERIYGNDTPEAIAATELLKNTLKGLHESAKKSAVEEIRAERKREIEEQKQADIELDHMIEEIEDEYDVDLTSTGSDRLRKGFFAMLQKMSPKDERGNITQFADHHAVWEAYQAQVSSKKPAENRAKDLAARSTTQSGASAGSKPTDDATVKWLKENGII